MTVVIWVFPRVISLCGALLAIPRQDKRGGEEYSDRKTVLYITIGDNVYTIPVSIKYYPFPYELLFMPVSPVQVARLTPLQGITDHLAMWILPSVACSRDCTER
jgi:hypothetical protein